MLTKCLPGVTLITAVLFIVLEIFFDCVDLAHPGSRIARRCIKSTQQSAYFAYIYGQWQNITDLVL